METLTKPDEVCATPQEARGDRRRIKALEKDIGRKKMAVVENAERFLLLIRQQMRILFVTPHGYLPQITGGAEQSSHIMCRLLQERHHDVAVLAKFSGQGFFGLRAYISRQLSSSDLATDRGLGYTVFRVSNVETSLVSVIDKLKPDAMIVTVLGAKSLPLAAAVASTGLPAIIYVRNVELNGSCQRFPQGARIKIVANSRFTREFLSKKFGIDAQVIPPIIVPSSYRTNTLRSHVVLINPHPRKGGDLAVFAAVQLPKIPFLFVESWPLSRELKKKYKRALSGCSNVRWLPPTSDMRKIYRRAKFVIMPSKWEEAWGRVATEAQVSGIPVIATDIGGLPESVGPGGVLMSRDASPEDWVNAIRKLWDDDTEYCRLSEYATAHSMRLEIQPEYLTDKTIELLSACRN
jgi:glycosyltransferase involved in cell wall biosynthesis